MTAGLVASLVTAPDLAAQVTAAVDLLGTVVEYDGFLVSGAGALSPSFRYDTRGFTFGAQGTWLTFESGNEIVLGNVAAGWLSPAWRGWRIEASGVLGLAKYTESSGSGHTLLRSRIHFQDDQAGGWAGLASGVSGNVNAHVPLEMNAGVWSTQAVSRSGRRGSMDRSEGRHRLAGWCAAPHHPPGSRHRAA